MIRGERSATDVKQRTYDFKHRILSKRIEAILRFRRPSRWYVDEHEIAVRDSARSLFNWTSIQIKTLV